MSPSTAPALGLSLALLTACYASHGPGSGDGGLSSADGSARADGSLRDAATDVRRCEDLPGASACGCVGGYRRCDTCEERCPEGQLCWPSLGVCRPADGVGSTGLPVFDSCALPGSGEAVGPRYCQGGGPCVLSGPDELFGPCMSDAFCREARTAEPPLPSDVRCIASFGLEWRPPPPVETCPDPRFCGGPCGRCPYGEYGAQSCVGIDAERPFGICADLWSITCTNRRAPPRGSACLKVESRADDNEGWRVDAETCHAYDDRYDGVSCYRRAVR